MVLVRLACSAAAFAPVADSFTLRTAAGQVQTLTAGNAFSNPALVITGDVVVMIAFAAAVIAAALWRPGPARGGAAGRGDDPDGGPGHLGARPGRRGSPAEASSVSRPRRPGDSGSRSAPRTSPAFWIYFGFLIALIVSCAWMLFTPQPVLATPAAATPDAAGTPDAGTGTVTPRAGGRATPRPPASAAAAGDAATADHAAAGARDGDGPG